MSAWAGNPGVAKPWECKKCGHQNKGQTHECARCGHEPSMGRRDVELQRWNESHRQDGSHD